MGRVRRCPQHGRLKSLITHCKKGDVILAMDRPWIEAGLKWAFVRESDLPAFLVQRVARTPCAEGS